MRFSFWKCHAWHVLVFSVFCYIAHNGYVKCQDDYDYEYTGDDYFDSASHRRKYNGKYVGKLNSYHHQVNGQLYAVNEKTLLLKEFQYDGQGRDAFFYGGGTGRPGSSGMLTAAGERFAVRTF